MKPLIKRKDGSEKCPHCGTVFGPESLHPFDVAVREEFRKRRSKAAKLGWRRRRARLKTTLSPKVTKWM
jgi:uncharacterized Zn finger protein (UPF0148 family)